MTRIVRSTLGSKGQITVPKVVRERLRAVQGGQLEFVLDDDTVTLRAVTLADDPLQAWFGVAPLPEDQTVNTWIREMRDQEDEAARLAQSGQRIISLRPGEPIKL
ncbi:AbrB/MazE/SpoVT family DNA-binding domain-containing protein [Deinococcus sp.]|uniref:AbrB/MazE/SpoVT family DNA-binding domain-containing protein n=1 Tax=Deinococcus sp. TaxID=47478 RepID=UPI003B5B9965